MSSSITSGGGVGCWRCKRCAQFFRCCLLGLLVLTAAAATCATIILIGAYSLDVLLPDAAVAFLEAGERRQLNSDTVGSDKWRTEDFTGLANDIKDAEVELVQWRVESASPLATALGAEHSCLILRTVSDDVVKLEKMGHFYLRLELLASPPLPGRLHASAEACDLRANLTVRAMAERFLEDLPFHLLMRNCHLAAEAAFMWSAPNISSPGEPNPSWQRAFRTVSRALPQVLRPMLLRPPPPKTPPRRLDLEDDNNMSLALPNSQAADLPGTEVNRVFSPSFGVSSTGQNSRKDESYQSRRGWGEELEPPGMEYDHTQLRFARRWAQSIFASGVIEEAEFSLKRKKENQTTTVALHKTTAPKYWSSFPKYTFADSECHSLYSFQSRFRNPGSWSECALGSCDPNKKDGLISHSDCSGPLSKDERASCSGHACKPKLEQSPGICAFLLGFGTSPLVVLCPFWSFAASSGKDPSPHKGQVVLTARDTCQCRAAQPCYCNPGFVWEDGSCNMLELTMTTTTTTTVMKGVERVVRLPPRCNACPDIGIAEMEHSMRNESAFRCLNQNCSEVTYECALRDDFCEVRPPDCNSKVEAHAEFAEDCGEITTAESCTQQGLCFWEEPKRLLRFSCVPSWPDVVLEFCRDIDTADLCSFQKGCEWTAQSVERSPCPLGDFLPCRARDETGEDVRELCGNVVERFPCERQLACFWEEEKPCICPPTHQGDRCETNISIWRGSSICSSRRGNTQWCHGLVYGAITASADDAMCQASGACGEWHGLKSRMKFIATLSIIVTFLDIFAVLATGSRVLMKARLGRRGIILGVTAGILMVFVTDVAGPAFVISLNSEALKASSLFLNSACFSTGEGYQKLVGMRDNFEAVEQFNTAMLAMGVVGIILEVCVAYQEVADTTDGFRALVPIASMLMTLTETIVSLLDLFGNIMTAIDGLNTIEMAVLGVDASTSQTCVQANPAALLPERTTLQLDAVLISFAVAGTLIGTTCCATCFVRCFVAERDEAERDEAERDKGPSPDAAPACTIGASQSDLSPHAQGSVTC